jgi:magnesium transporter
MMYAYRPQAGKLARLDHAEPLTGAIWVDLYHPQPAQVDAVTAYGITVPTLAEMEEIEISNRLYRENGADYMTVVLPGMSDTKTPMVGPVTFILTPAVLVTVRHHVPRPFETYPTRAERLGLGCATPDQVFLGLIEEIVGRLADLLESAGRGLDQVSRAVFLHGDAPRAETLKSALDQVGREGELLGRVRLGHQLFPADPA